MSNIGGWAFAIRFGDLRSNAAHGRETGAINKAHTLRTSKLGTNSGVQIR